MDVAVGPTTFTYGSVPNSTALLVVVLVNRRTKIPLTRDMDLVERALVTAYEAHFKQKDLAGCPYILHPIRVMEQMDTDEERAIALLHDVLEDSDIPVEHLAKWFPENVVEAVVAVTKPPRPEIDDEEDH